MKSQLVHQFCPTAIDVISQKIIGMLGAQNVGTKEVEYLVNYVFLAKERKDMVHGIALSITLQ